MNIASVAVLTSIVTLAALAIWRNVKKGAPCECGCSCKTRGGGNCHCGN